MDERTIKEAANDHARQVMDDNDFYHNQEAREAVEFDFIAGANWCLGQLKTESEAEPGQ